MNALFSLSDERWRAALGIARHVPQGRLSHHSQLGSIDPILTFLRRHVYGPTE